MTVKFVIEGGCTLSGATCPSPTHFLSEEEDEGVAAGAGELAGAAAAAVDAPEAGAVAGAAAAPGAAGVSEVEESAAGGLGDP